MGWLLIRQHLVKSLDLIIILSDSFFLNLKGVSAKGQPLVQLTCGLAYTDVTELQKL